MTQRFPRTRQFVAARLSPTELYGLHLTAGLVLIVVAGTLFGFLAHHVVTASPLTLLDARLAQHFHGYADSGWTVLMLAVTHAHATVPLLVLAGLFGLYLFGARAYYWLLTLVVAVPGGMTLNVLLKQIFQRMRPQFDEPVVMLTTYSFPSGHANGATLLYGMLAAYCISRQRTRTARVLTCVAAATMAILVAFSRVYLGAHYLTDVVAGIIEGCAWLTLCLTATATLRRRKLLSQRQGAQPGQHQAWDQKAHQDQRQDQRQDQQRGKHQG